MSNDRPGCAACGTSLAGKAREVAYCDAHNQQSWAAAWRDRTALLARIAELESRNRAQGGTIDAMGERISSLCRGGKGFHAEQAARVAELEQALWCCAGTAGEDLDGDPTPAALKHPDICVFALNAVTSLRKDYDAALAELDSREIPSSHE